MMARASAATNAGVVVRPYTEADEAAALGVLVASLGGGPAGRRPPEFWRWKHFDNPFGRSFIIVAEVDDRIVGVRALMRWRFVSDSVEVRAVRAVDTATHPQWQGKGLFTRLTLEALDRLRGDADLVFNTPNDNSLPGYLKMGWRTIGKVPISVRILRPVRFARRVRGLKETVEMDGAPPPVDAPSASEVLERLEIAPLLEASEQPAGRLVTARDPSYLHWRYASAPLLDYRAVVEERAGAVTGMAIFRVRRRGALWEATLCELLAETEDARTLRKLLRSIASAAPVDHITCHFHGGSAQLRAARRRGFVPTPGGMTFVVNPLRNELPLNPEVLESWALSLGDLEVF